MPNFGGKNARSGKGAGAGRSAGGSGRPAAGGRGAGKAREDGRGGRSPKREFKVEEKRGGKRPAFFEAEAPKRERGSEERGGRSRSEGSARGDGRKDWSPEGRKPRHGAAGRPGSDRGARAGDDRPRRSFGDRDDRPRRSFDDRNDRGGRSEGRPGARSFERDERPRRSSEDRPRRSFADRDERPARSSEDRPRRSFGNDRGGRSEGQTGARSFDRDSRRPDRVARDQSRERSFEGARSRNGGKKSFVEDTVLERLESVALEDVAGSFEEMNLHPKVLAALAGMGAVSPFPIQAATIPAAMTGVDVLGRGKTGSGKTVSFTVPMVQKLIAAGSVPREPGKPRALILAPTRELADQIDRTVNGLARPVGFYTTCIYGGVPQRKQENAMSRGVDIVVATPGRLEDLIAQRIVDLSEVETLIVDEADHMSELGFIEPVRRIMAAVSPTAQRLLFSATLDKAVQSLVNEFLPAPFVYEVPEEDEDHSNITHRVLVVDDEDRSAVLLRLVQGAGKALIFARTKMTAERLSESLTEAGVPAARLHGDLNQSQRNRNLERFTSGACRVLVATDVAARGIHVDDIALVIQVDPPQEYKTYLHRAGRTGRAGKEGTVITLIHRSRRRRLEDLLHRADRDGIFSDVRPSSALLEELAGPIAPPPAPQGLDFGDSRGSGRGGRSEGRSGSGSRGRSSDGRGGRSGSGDRSGFGRSKEFGGRGRSEGRPRRRD